MIFYIIIKRWKQFEITNLFPQRAFGNHRNYSIGFDNKFNVLKGFKASSSSSSIIAYDSIQIIMSFRNILNACNVAACVSQF